MPIRVLTQQGHPLDNGRPEALGLQYCSGTPWVAVPRWSPVRRLFAAGLLACSEKNKVALSPGTPGRCKITFPDKCSDFSMLT